MLRALYQALIGTSINQGKREKVALHMAKNYMYETRKNDSLYPDLRVKVRSILDEMAANGKPMYVFEGVRTWKRQDALYAKGGVTNAKGGQSYHNYGLAADIIFEHHRWSPPDESWWDEFGAVVRSHGLEWGGDWKSFQDRPHVQLPTDIYATWQELRPYFL